MRRWRHMCLKKITVVCASQEDEDEGAPTVKPASAIQQVLSSLTLENKSRIPWSHTRLSSENIELICFTCWSESAQQLKKFRAYLQVVLRYIGDSVVLVSLGSRRSKIPDLDPSPFSLFIPRIHIRTS